MVAQLCHFAGAPFRLRPWPVEQPHPRAAFVVSTPDAPVVQQKFAASRGWMFPMVSHAGNTFAQDMGYRTATRLHPGMSVFKRKDGRILRVSDVAWSPGDDFCTIWHMFDLLPRDRPVGCPSCGIRKSRKRSVTDVSLVSRNSGVACIRRYLRCERHCRLGAEAPQTS
jgi:hypothetical protein